MNAYYEINASKYIEDTINCDMRVQYEFFLKYMPTTGKILDIGFGSGRDMIYFSKKGFTIKGIDPTKSFVDKMIEKGYDVELKASEDLNEVNEYDGIWACASLLHVRRNQLSDVVKNCSHALKKEGIMYCSFKYGDFEGIKNERYFNYLNEDLLNEMIKDTGLKLIETSITYDVRNDRKDEKWLNVILKKL